jgi:hypothetical protein
MKILAFSDNPRFSLLAGGKAVAGLTRLAVKDMGAEAKDADIAYLDCSGLSPEAAKKALALLKRLRAGMAWGVIDPKGAIADPAALFLDGASDYVGTALIKAGIEKGRFKRVLEFASLRASLPARAAKPKAPAAPDSGHKTLESFPGWQAVKPGEVWDFHFLYAAIANPAALKSKIGETRFAELRERFSAYIAKALAEAESQAWMKTDSGLLFLIPPSERRAGLAIEACLRILLNAPLVGYESFGLECPFGFVFALHQGHSPYQSPGKTGTVVSEDLNFIFHLGTKKAEADRLYVSAKASGAIGKKLADLFVPAGRFEGCEILKSRKFL